MLTGDKFETAENIGFSCKLIDPSFHMFKIRTKEDAMAFLTQETRDQSLKLMKEGVKRAIIIEATALVKIFATQER